MLATLRKLLLYTLLLCTLLSIGLVAALKFINPPVWSWQLYRHLNPMPTSPLQSQHRWVSLDQIATSMQLAVIAAEDQKFPQHHGFDLDAIEQAIDHYRQGKKLRGASTLSQQTAKNLFLWPARSLVRKGAEAWFTGWMELLLGKRRILELYLNIVEFGPGIYGVEAASWHYFNHSARQLASYQAARLAAVLPNPWRFSVQRPSAYTLKRSRWIQRQMRQLGKGVLSTL